MDFAELIRNEYVVCSIMAIVIFAVTQLLKLPIKAVTKNIERERLRRIINALILLIPFGLGILFEYLYNGLFLEQELTFYKGLMYGSSGVALYGFIERFFKVKVENPYNSEEGEAVLELVDDVSKDKVIDEKDKDSVKAFWKKINKSK